MIYNGQEAGNDRRLSFFSRDPIDWVQHRTADFYRRLIGLRRDTPALWSGRWGAPMISVPTDHASEVIGFVRQDEHHKVFAIFNFSNRALTANLFEELYVGRYTDFLSGRPVTLGPGASIDLPAWDYRVLVSGT